MARFKYLGEPPRTWVTQYGPCVELQIPSCSGVQVFTPVPPATEFVVGQDMGYDVTDNLSLSVMRSDTQRFEEIV